jgi:phage nucleotide-binding protein
MLHLLAESIMKTLMLMIALQPVRSYPGMLDGVEANRIYFLKDMRMAINLTDTNIDCDFVKVLVFGDSGVGKTHLILTAPKPIIISTESGLLPLRGKSIPVLKVNTMQDMYDAYEYVTTDESMSKYETICLDSITDLAETILASHKKENKDGRAAYGKLNDDMADLIRAFRDIPSHHVYMTGKMARIEDANSGFAKYKCMMPGRTLVQQMPYWFDEILCLHMGEDAETGKFRYLQTQPSITHDAKDRSGKLDDPEAPDLTVIFNKIVGEKHKLKHKETK